MQDNETSSTLSEKMIDNIRNGILSRMRFKGWTMQNLADLLHKDTTTISRQLSKSGFSHINISTLIDDYVTLLGGEIYYETDASAKAVDESDLTELRATIATLGQQNDELQEKLKEAGDTIGRVRARNVTLQADIDVLIQSNKGLVENNARLIELLKAKESS